MTRFRPSLGCRSRSCGSAAAKDDISALPDPVEGSVRPPAARRAAGAARRSETKPLPQFGGGVFALRERYDADAYRMIYVVALRKAVYVLHAFMKKSKSGIGLPKPDSDLIALRLKRAQALDVEDWDEGHPVRKKQR